MKLLGCVLGFELGGDNDMDSKMDTDNGASATKKETNTSSKPTTTNTTTTNKTNEQSKNATSGLSEVRNFDFVSCENYLFFLSLNAG
jgi:hypothetical protein